MNAILLFAADGPLVTVSRPSLTNTVLVNSEGALAIDNGLLDKTQRAEVQRLIKPDVKIEDIYSLSSMQ